MIEIQKITFHHIHKAAKGQFHKEVLEILEKNGVDKILSEELIGEYRKNIGHFPELNGQYSADSLTRDLKRIDKARDAAYRVIQISLSVMADNLDDEVVAYYKAHIRPLFASFGDFSVKMDYASETANLRSFCHKLKALDYDILNKAFVTEQQVDALDNLNEKFESIYVERTDKRSKFESPVTLAKKMEEQWKLIATFIVTKANEAVSDVNRETVEKFQITAAALNEHIDYYRKNYVVRGRKK